MIQEQILMLSLGCLAIQLCHYLPSLPFPPFFPFLFFKSLNINQVKVEQRFIQIDVAWNCSATWRGLKAVPHEFKIASVKLTRSQVSLAKRKGSNTVLSFSM